jgi:hypothetical protein
MIKTAMWAVTIGVISLVLAAMAASVLRPGDVVFAVLLMISVAVVCALLALVVEITPRVGAAGGMLSAVLCATVFALMVAMAPLAPGATRPGLRWQEAVAFVVLMTACAAAGWFGTQRGLALARRRKA